MRPRLILALAAIALGVGLSQPAVAGGLLHDDTHAYGGEGDTYVHHHVQAPSRVRHVYHYHKAAPRHLHVVHGGGDPYAWRYKRRGYYPYYTSGYWVPAKEMKYRYRYTYYGPKYRYYPAQGYGYLSSPYRWRW